jgi:hypothetical protein
VGDVFFTKGKFSVTLLLTLKERIKSLQIAFNEKEKAEDWHHFILNVLPPDLQFNIELHKNTSTPCRNHRQH